MIEGILIVNFEPAFIGFSSSNEMEKTQATRRYCSKEEIRSLLVELNVIDENQYWCPREVILRLPVKMPKAVLERLQLSTLLKNVS